MLQATEELSKSVRSFQEAVRRSNSEFEVHGEYPWERLLKHDAPRALGDTFLACLGATIMDGGRGSQSYLDAKKVIYKHIEACKDMPVKDGASAVSLETDLVPFADLQKHIENNSSLSSQALQALSTQLPSWTDVHFWKVDDILVGACSPRTAALRAPYVDYEDGMEDADTLTDLVDDERQAPADANEQIDGAVYCEDCEMWLNGPTQWEDHKIGKKHKKNVAKGGANKVALNTKPNPKAQAKKVAASATPPAAPDSTEQEVRAPQMETASMENFATTLPYPQQAYYPTPWLYAPYGCGQPQFFLAPWGAQHAASMQMQYYQQEPWQSYESW